MAGDRLGLGIDVSKRALDYATSEGAVSGKVMNTASGLRRLAGVVEDAAQEPAVPSEPEAEREDRLFRLAPDVAGRRGGEQRHPAAASQGVCRKSGSGSGGRSGSR